MTAKNILDFLAKLEGNNNREWFNANKESYLVALKDFEEIITALIIRIAEFDESVKNVQAKDCIFRIYRDVRFSHDKSPYKNHFGGYIASKGGRKSEYAGYYVHIELRQNMLSGGLYCPQPQVLKEIRKAVFENIDEFKEIVEAPAFSKLFSLGEMNKLKTVPRGFPKDFPDAEYLKHRHYAFAHELKDEFWLSDSCVEKAAEIFRILYPCNRFLNYTVEDVLG